MLDVQRLYRELVTAVEGLTFKEKMIFAASLDKGEPLEKLPENIRAALLEITKRLG
jgi:hypothetical protein